MTLPNLARISAAATPGPWAFEQIERGAIQVGLVWDDDEQPLSGCIEADEGTVVEGVAEVVTGYSDAALIAAAPEMARLLQECADGMRYLRGEDVAGMDPHMRNGEVIHALLARLAEFDRGLA